MSAALVSVVMPAYNAQRTLPASIASALAQDHRDLELIVVDDCSSDGTWELVQQAARGDARIRPIRHARNGGVAAARNTAIAAAGGRYISFLDSDDRWLAGKLSAQVAHMQASGARICYSAYRRVDGDGNVLGVVTPPASLDRAAMLRSNHIGNLTGIYDRSLGDAAFRRIGHEDYVFWLEMLRRAGQASRVPDPAPLAEYLVQPESMSGNKLRAARWQWRIYRDAERMGLAEASACFAHYAWNALAKRGGGLRFP